MNFNFQMFTKSIYFIALFTSLSMFLGVKSATAETTNKNVKSRINKINLTLEKSKSLDWHLFSAQSFINGNDTTSFEKKRDFYLSEPNQIDSKTKSFLLAKATVGQASWYGPGFHGRRTASGEIYNQYAFTAAHRYYRFGTQVRVTNLNTGLSVIVRINDRGPYIHGRIIDLSKAAASSIGLLHSGVAPVRVEILGR